MNQPNQQSVSGEGQRDQDPTELPSTDNPPQPNDPKVKQWANAEEAKFKANIQKQTEGNRHPQHAIDPQHGSKVRDKGSHR